MTVANRPPNPDPNNDQQKDNPIHKVGESRVGPAGIIGLAVYMFAFTSLLFYSLIQFWITKPVDNVTINYLGGTLSFTYEAVQLVVVLLCGAIGGMLHALRSMSWYVGNRELRRSWIVKYVMQPCVGATLALLFYFVVRAGLFPASVNSASLLGFAAMSGLVGMFSDQAVIKLKDVAETLLTRPKAGADAVPQDQNNRHQPNPRQPENAAAPKPE